MMDDMQARMTSRGRVTIPIDLRRKSGSEAGMHLIVREVDDQIVVMTMENYVRSQRGKYKGKGLLQVHTRWGDCGVAVISRQITSML